ncbi:hypothetical protein VOLCADRAFT_89546 [Volvox carteri f. nagariensis]|uniref:Uncharacterized protein n=1 Tax=Volvox carteri f. nagariensis TaxID=3068 RepID=D8TS45_VOLCA|nr:uncharacterized protein VOLCADRAFT_89546 [Volvox carteri f. nagariensis]EFJ49761.1 hypothetical protein VOLCADRAFT_89546 [Volvox carteri f. nagariensis]|eukprot:XP_002949268.1 hypothetical protein VOLCADRAFT_89546 [Volvox carteri f. nagariensis]
MSGRPHGPLEMSTSCMTLTYGTQMLRRRQARPCKGKAVGVDQHNEIHVSPRPGWSKHTRSSCTQGSFDNNHNRLLTGRNVSPGWRYPEVAPRPRDASCNHSTCNKLASAPASDAYSA